MTEQPAPVDAVMADAWIDEDLSRRLFLKRALQLSAGLVVAGAVGGGFGLGFSGMNHKVKRGYGHSPYGRGLAGKSAFAGSAESNK